MLYHEYRARQEGYKIVAGIDEAGRGPLAGPVVAAAVILKTNRFKNRIDDSKKLTPSQRENAFSEIYDKAFVGLGIINERAIDSCNILCATKFAMRQALYGLSITPDLVLVDGPINLEINIPNKGIIRGDSKSLSIACASILAKVIRDRIMDIYHRLYPEYGFNRHKGYGTFLHIRNLKKFGPCLIHRKSFNKVLNG